MDLAEAESPADPIKQVDHEVHRRLQIRESAKSVRLRWVELRSASQRGKPGCSRRVLSLKSLGFLFDAAQFSRLANLKADN